jgi:hypothetical protein
VGTDLHYYTIFVQFVGISPHFWFCFLLKSLFFVPPASRFRGSGDPYAKTAVSYLSLIILERVPTCQITRFHPQSYSYRFRRGLIGECHRNDTDCE